MAKVLVIEDEPDIRTRCGLVLDAAGHAVLAVAMGSDGLQARRDEPGQLVALLNHSLPDADSATLLRTIETEPAL